LSTPRKIAIACLLALGVLLVAAFFLVYFGGNDPGRVELTSPNRDSGASAVSGSTDNPAAQPALPQLTSEDEVTEFRVYVAGAVNNPGVYALSAGDRLVDGVEAAGGAMEEADLEAVNLAMRVEDEGYYYIPARSARSTSNADQETMVTLTPTPRFPEAATNRTTAEFTGEAEESGEEDGEPAALVNLNTANQGELEKLPSIGPTRARAIIAYREENGPFAAVDEVTAVSGIGQGILDNLQGLITVGEAP
jgi:competence protein ComEA